VSAVADRHSELAALDVQVLSISVDSHFVHKMWNDLELSKMVEGGVPFPMLSDRGGKVGRRYGVYRASKGVNIRGRYLIDPDGVIQAMEILASKVGRNLDETIRQIKAFQHVRQSNGAEVTPAGWQPGETVLQPGPDLVGNVWKVWTPGDDD
jgi:peroxiredoxin (alkyl hydroperoxide reductase subunit C)